MTMETTLVTIAIVALLIMGGAWLYRKEREDEDNE